MQTRAGIRLPIGMVSHSNVFAAVAIFSLALTHRSLSPGILSTDGNAESLTSPLHWMVLPMIFNKLLSHDWGREKMATAFFTISRSGSHSFEFTFEAAVLFL
jgi:hypothetical protein